MKRLLKRAKLRSFPTSPVYKFGYRVPKDWREAKELDKKNGNRKWAEGSAPTQHHLGCDFLRDKVKTLCMDPSGYISRMEELYVLNFGIKPKKDIGPVHSPLEKGDHPELDVSAFLNDEETQIYQSLVGSIQWVVTLGSFDINTAVISMSSFQAQPRQGHLKCLRRIIAYLCKYCHFKIRFHTEEPDFSWFKDNKQNWSNSVYEDKPKDAPKPLGKPVHLTSYFDANLMHDVLSGKAVTGILHFLNKTPVDWYCKKKNTSECATYSAKYLSC